MTFTATPIAASVARYLAAPQAKRDADAKGVAFEMPPDLGGLAVANEIDEFCLKTWRKPLRVCLGSIGDYFSRVNPESEGSAEGEPTPYVEIAPIGNLTGGNEPGKDYAYVGIRVVVNASDRESLGAPFNDKGVFVLNFEPGMEHLSSLIQELASRPIHKGISESWANGEDGTGFPRCETTMMGTYYGKISGW